MGSLLNENDNLNKQKIINKKASYSKRKDANPVDTILKIQNILAKYNINPIELWSTNSDNIAQNFVFSNRISLNGTDIGCNGKGTSIEYALASGLAEVMERLQAGLLTEDLSKNPIYSGSDVSKYEMCVCEDDFCKIRNSFFDKHILNMFKLVYPAHTFPEFKDVKEMITFLRKNDFYLSDNFMLTQYYSYKDKDCCFLPRIFLNGYFVRSNGYSAGNTKEEALVQAMSEIFERHCMSKILYNDLTMPDIPYEKYCKFDDIVNIIKRYEELGLTIKIKDASLAEGFPVVAAVATDKRTDTTIVDFGAHPILPIAIERTLTEISQGGSILEIINGINKHYPKNYFKSFYFDKSSWCHKLETDGGAPYFNNADKEADWQFDDKTWQNESQSNKELLKSMINLCEEKNYDIYIKDMSFLDFPCFHVYIPENADLISNFEYDKAVYARNNFENHTLDVLNKLKNDVDVEKIYKTTILTYNLPLEYCFYRPSELGIIIGIIAGYKLKKFDDLHEIVNNIFNKEINKMPELAEFMDIIKPIVRLIEIEEYSEIEKHIEKLFEYCYGKTNENSNNNSKTEENLSNNIEFENNYKETAKLKESFEKILKVQKENPIDNSYLKDFFDTIKK